MNAASRRKPTNISLDKDLVSQAKLLDINLSRACEQGLRSEIAEERARRWRAENKDAIASSNAFVDGGELPLAGSRQF